MMGRAVEQETAWDGVLSIRGTENVLRSVGQVCELMAVTVCVLCPSGLYCPGLFSLLLTHREKDKTGLRTWTHSAFSLSSFHFATLFPSLFKASVNNPLEMNIIDESQQGGLLVIICFNV